ncbi:MAG: glycerol-3-phosphate acyltransferase, partial [Bacilli bacterium]|nr:glycerol-3-phosphate acyltransferase [Bacilli bacterium]
IPGLTYFLFLKITKKVSLTSIIVSILITVVTWVWIILFMLGVIPTNLMYLPMYGKTLCPSFVYGIVITFSCCVLVIRHKENIKRIKEGTERTITWMK